MDIWSFLCISTIVFFYNVPMIASQEDPISSILDNLIVADVSDYLPADYRKRKESLKAEKTNVETTSTTTSTTTTTTTTTTTWVGPPPTFCFKEQDVCAMSSTILVVSGLLWTEELSFPNSISYQRERTVLARELGRSITLGFFGIYLNFVEVEGFFRNPSEGVLVDYYVEFNGFNRDVSSDDILEDLKKTLNVNLGNGSIASIGDFEVDLARNYFVVVDPVQKLEIIDEQVLEEQIMLLPDWAWLVIFFGASGTLIISLLLGISCYRRIQTERIKRRTINNTTLDGLRALFEDTKNISDVEEKADEEERFKTSKDRSDFWTLQRKGEVEHKKYRDQTLRRALDQPQPPTPSVGSCGGESPCSSLTEDLVLAKDKDSMVDLLKKGFKRASLRQRPQSSNLSNMNLLEDESFESMRSYDDGSEIRI